MKVNEASFITVMKRDCITGNYTLKDNRYRDVTRCSPDQVILLYCNDKRQNLLNYIAILTIILITCRGCGSHRHGIPRRYYSALSDPSDLQTVHMI
jgi:hypothetical protein